MKTRLSTTTSLIHVLISIVVVGLLISVNLTMANQPSTSPPKGEVNTSQDYMISEVDTPPRVISAFPPRYPDDAKINKIEGRVLLKFVVDTDGKAWGAEVVEADPEDIFDQSALDGVVQYEFEPAIKDGMPVSCIVRMPIVYTLE